MKRLSAVACGLGLLASSGVAQAAHHQWMVSEIYSNLDGSVQFVELKGTANNEQFMGGFTVATLGTVATSVALNDLSSPSTAGAYVLLATAGYSALASQQGAPPPDIVLPNNFLQLDADTVRYAGITATDRTYSAGQLPKNGVDSLDFEHPTATVNSPQNFSGASGTIVAAGPVPALPRWGTVLLIGALVFGAGSLWRRRAPVVAA